MQIDYLGPSGTFSEQAARWLGNRLAGDTTCVAAASISEALGGVGAGVMAAVPVYNLIDGLITETPDRILHAELQIYAAVRVPIRIAVGYEEPLQPDGPVFSHPKALAQCSDYLTEHHPSRPRIATPSTADGVDRAMAEGGVALASHTAFEERGVPIVVEDATNNYLGRTNYTEFLLVGDRGLDVRFSNDSPVYRTILACDPQDDRPGLLAGLLSQLAFLNLNLARIHARPAQRATSTDLDPQVFFIEIMGSLGDEVRDALTASLSIGLRGKVDARPAILGEYPLFEIGVS